MSKRLMSVYVSAEAVVRFMPFALLGFLLGCGGGTAKGPNIAPPAPQLGESEFHLDPLMGGLDCSAPNYRNYIEPYMVAHPGGYLVFIIP
ncbi:MAG: hypothetical protein WAK56_07985, partial [Candidatus Sulfotelmatobacter sp.]